MQQTFGVLLRHLRKRSGMTQGELAGRLGYSRSMVAALEMDARLPNLDEVIDTYVPALGLQDARDLAAQLVELAAKARQVAPPPLFATHRQQPLSQSVQHLDTYRIPLPPTRLLGRDREVEILAERFLYQDVRLTTLVGPPGVGKTRLAQEVATRIAPFFPAGACFVSLAGVSTSDAVAGSIFAALDADLDVGTPLAALISYLRRKEILLVLDNFEQVLVAAPLVADLLGQCAGLRLLVTSRERLHLRAEHIAAIQPLALDAAAELFLARAVAANDQMLLSAIDHNLVRSVCQRLDCLPLAIELCAARTDYYSFDQIHEYLRTHPLDTLVEGPTDLPPHHRTLRGAILTSYNLLTNDERALLQALSVFVGGAAPAMAEEVWAGGEKDERFGEIVRSLVAKSLVQVETTTLGDKRLHLLESVREFAREQLVAEARLSTTRTQHCNALLRFARQGESHLWDADGDTWFKRMRLEAENWSLAVQWTFEQAMWQEMATLLLLFFALGGKGYRDWIERLLAANHDLSPDVYMAIQTCGLGADILQRSKVEAIRPKFQEYPDACINPLVRAKAWIMSCTYDVELVDAPEALVRAVDLARAGRTTPEITYACGYGWSREAVLPLCLEFSGTLRIDRGETVESTALLTEALALYHARGLEMENARILGFLGRAALMEGRNTEAISLFREALDSAIAAGDCFGKIEWRATLGLATVYAGDLGGARSLLVQAWEEAVAISVPFSLQISALFLCELAFTESDIDEARRWLTEAVTAAGLTSWVVIWKPIHRAMLAARLAAADGDDVRAATLYGFMHAYSDRIKLGPSGPVRDTAAPTMAEVRVRLGEEAYWRAYEEGSRLPPQDVLEKLVDNSPNQ